MYLLKLAHTKEDLPVHYVSDLHLTELGVKAERCQGRYEYGQDDIASIKRPAIATRFSQSTAQ